MPIDFQQFTVTRGANVSATVPSITCSALVVDSRTQQTKADFRVATLVWPDVMQTLSASEKNEVMDAILAKVIEIKVRGLG